jgi:hypothetical protein
MEREQSTITVLASPPNFDRGPRADVFRFRLNETLAGNNAGVAFANQAFHSGEAPPA